MRILLFDPFGGAAGDMVTGALLDCGADRDQVMAAMSSVVAEPTITEVTRCGIHALRIETHAKVQARTLEEVLEIVARANAPAAAVELAKRIFLRLGRAEEAVHGHHAHFHEVGADDAIADILGAATAFCSLKAESAAVLPVHLGRGSVGGAHGRYPVPSPATLAILNEAGLAVSFTDEGRELCTPTGAALLAEFATRDPESIAGASIISVGYGAGSRDPSHTPNVLRVVLCETGTSDADQVDILETNVDDVTGEVVAHTIARLMEEGARDASAVPAVMKKGRPGHLVRVVCSPADAGRLARLLVRELGTLGVRRIPAVHRHIAERDTSEVTVSTGSRSGTVAVKTGWEDGKAFSVKVEYDDAARLAADWEVPVREIMRLAEEEGWKEARRRERR
jgi:uncharacterized protein (TIGR00299 family) protein